MVPKRSSRPGLRGIAGGMAGLGLGCLILGLTLAPALAQQAGTNATPVPKQAVKSTAPPAKIAAPAKKTKAQLKAELEEEEAFANPFAAEHPQLILEGLQCQIHHDGQVQQEIRAKTGRFDEAANILDLQQLNVKYLDQGTTTAGQVTCGSGRVWTTDHPDTVHPEKSINAHDMLLQQNVRLETKEMLLTAPEMRYNALTATISSDKKYQQRMAVGRGFLIGRGQRFELKLIPEKNSVEYWKAFGNPAVMQKLEKPVLKP